MLYNLLRLMLWGAGDVFPTSGHPLLQKSRQLPEQLPTNSGIYNIRCATADRRPCCKPWYIPGTWYEVLLLLYGINGMLT